MSERPTVKRKWSVIVAIIALCFVLGYGIGYAIGKLFM